MCGRYALALRPSQVRQMLEDDGMLVENAPDDEGDEAPRQSYNFAPGYHGIVYRADTPDWGCGPHHPRATSSAEHTASSATSLNVVKYRLQSMKWGLIPFWTKQNPEYSKILKTINCRDDSLSKPGGMWGSMKARKRCVIIAQGFYEWLRINSKEKMPHFIKREDGHLMFFAGLWDCAQYEDSESKKYSYTIITTDSNAQLKFLHNRMPVILEPGSEDLKMWLDPSRHEWSRELQSLLRPFDGQLKVFSVSKDVGKVGNNSPSLIIPLDSKENKSNIANVFANVSKKTESTYKHARDSGDEETTKVLTESSVSSSGELAEKLAKSPLVNKRIKLSTSMSGSKTKEARLKKPTIEKEERFKTKLITNFFTKV
ncbi:DUF159 domain protein [Dactylonectria estremocensis]|uniref:DUF159 domain protein n=1 Tax=Dactylonectria estremocensis TaxID=1079267 RepID=A0A9P9F0U8_9HYPO|nr:DUF159 domain protein [Dactylonectria estremocensis]